MNPSTTSHEDCWKRLIEDPNDIQRLSLWIEVRQKQSGDRGALDALRRAADLPASWLAKIWLTRPLLEQGKLDESMRLYDEALRLAPQSSLAVQEIAGHLGEAGYFAESLELLLPIYSPIDHGPFAGFNLFNASEDSENWEAAQEVLDRMKRVDWKPPFKEIIRIRQEKLDLLRQCSKPNLFEGSTN